MNEGTTKGTSNRDLQLVIALLMIGIAAFQLGMAATGRGIFRDQHLGTALEYARGKIDLLQPVILGFNANGTPTPLDFPIWQAITAALMKAFGLWFGWGNVVSLLFQFCSLWPLFYLARHLFSERAAWWAILFILIQPLTIIIGGEAGGDSTASAFALWFVYLCFRMMRSGSWSWWPTAAVFGCLSAMTKAPFFMVAGLTTFFWLLHEQPRNRKFWIQLASVGAVSSFAFLVWNRHAEHLYKLAEFPLMNMNVSESKAMRDWYFGTTGYRLNPFNWARGAWRLLNYAIGNLGLIILLLLGLRFRNSLLAWLWLAAAACATLLFTPLVLEHFHYFFIFSPSIALLLACSAQELEAPVWQCLRAGTLLRLAIVTGFCVFSLMQSFQAIHLGMWLDRYPAQTAQQIRDHTTPSDKLVVFGQVWGAPFVRAERQGLTGGFGFRSGWLEDSAKVARLEELGYTKLVFMNPSPYSVALTEVTGTHTVRMENLREQLPKVAANWPVAFESPTLLIVNIPTKNSSSTNEVK